MTRQIINKSVTLILAASVLALSSVAVMQHTMVMDGSTVMVDSPHQPCDAQHDAKICSVVGSMTATISERLAHLPLAPAVVSVASAVPALLLLLSLLLFGPILHRPPKLYLAYNVLRF